MRKQNNKFSFIELKNRLADAPILAVKQPTNSQCDFDFMPAAQGYKIDKDVFYCCEFHKKLVDGLK